ncbi:MAG: DUF1127 domain-containing protein [Acetobacteraceae bacterium]|jgi:uncharacterized protein YjiS (DUF1127 family)|nr:DUF1127 domain-containing protein [Acetobacteraceae bacterium]
MDARITKEETALLLNLAPSRHAREVEAIRLAALRARDEAIGQALARGVAAIYRGIRAALLFIIEYPRRRAVFEQLQAMSDRELADIGLERADLVRVFDEDFTLGRTLERREAAKADRPAQVRPANSNVPMMVKAAA